MNCILLLSISLEIALFGANAMPAVAQVSIPADTVSAETLYRHNPYDLSSAAEADSSDVYASRSNHLLAAPSYVWRALVYPLGELTIYAEYAELVPRIYKFFISKDGRFGVLPQVQLGGESGTGGGVRVFHRNVAGKGKRFDGFFIYSGGRGQTGQGLYLHPNLLGSRLLWSTEGGYLRTRNENANINAAVRKSETRLFRIDQIDVRTTIGWRLNTGWQAYFKPNASAEGWFGYGRRDFRQIEGLPGALTDPGSTPVARLLTGLWKEIGLYRFGGRIALDNRDHRTPARDISHSLNYKLPGRIVVEADGLYHYFRDLGYPERGGLLEAEAEVVTGAHDVRFYRVAVRAHYYMTLFWRNRILAFRTRLEKVRRFSDGIIPYTELIQLGGSTQMRGYRRGYFRGQGSLLLNVEYRYPIWDTWNAFLFWDEGQIFDHYSEMGTDRFRTCWGGGISFRTEYGLLGKIQVGHSAVEKALLGLTLEQEF